MARFRFNRPISLRWNGLLFEGPALTVFEIPDEYNDELQSAMLVEPTFEWVDQDEGNTIRSRITALENAGAGSPLSNSNPLALGTAAPGTGLSSSRNDHVHPTTGLALSGHNHSGVYDPAGTSASGIAAHVAAADPHAIYLTDAEGDAQYSQLDHTHTSLSNNLQINKANSKVQLLNTTSGSGTEDGMYLLMADTDVGYLWNAETNGALVLGTGGAERARITPAGKFGIGTNAPAHQLEVVGPASVTVGVSAGGSGFAEIELVGQAGKNYITSDDTLSFDIGGTERATVATTGLNVTSGTLSQGGTAVSLSGHTHSGVYDPAGTAASEVSTHAAAADPHPTYLTSAEGNAAYEAINSVSTHNAATTSVHGITNTANLLTTSTSFANISTPAGSATTITSTTAGSPTDITGLTYTFTPTYNEDVFVQQNLVVTQSASPASAVNIIGKILVNGTAATPFSYFGLAASHGSPNGWTQGMSHTFVATSGVSYTVKCAAYKSSANGTYSASNGSTMSVIRVRA